MCFEFKLCYNKCFFVFAQRTDSNLWSLERHTTNKAIVIWALYIGDLLTCSFCPLLYLCMQILTRLWMMMTVRVYSAYTCNWSSLREYRERKISALDKWCDVFITSYSSEQTTRRCIWLPLKRDIGCYSTMEMIIYDDNIFPGVACIER